MQIEQKTYEAGVGWQQQNKKNRFPTDKAQLVLVFGLNKLS